MKFDKREAGKIFVGRLKGSAAGFDKELLDAGHSNRFFALRGARRRMSGAASNARDEPSVGRFRPFARSDPALPANAVAAGASAASTALDGPSCVRWRT